MPNFSDYQITILLILHRAYTDYTGVGCGHYIQLSEHPLTSSESSRLIPCNELAALIKRFLALRAIYAYARV